ncbi:MAG: phosphoribosylglycinamide formyltransferase [Firmicutes bacterium]|nr:phosphoribosylglycinamide formyltransferase [Bacillota bacterium]
MIRLAVFASGEGTNLEAILAAIAAGRLDAEVAAVASDRPECGAVARARRHGLPTWALCPSDFPDKAAYERALAAAVTGRGEVDVAVLAGYMRIAGPVLRETFPCMVNLHPSLLPCFPGRDAVAQALAAGVRVTGCTVHFVDEGVDTGPIIAQRAVAVRPGDDAERLRARIQRAEHRLLPEVLSLFAQGRIRREGRRVEILPRARAARPHGGAGGGGGWREPS